MPTYTDIHIINPWTPLQPCNRTLLTSQPFQGNLQRAPFLICKEMGVANHCPPHCRDIQNHLKPGFFTC